MKVREYIHTSFPGLVLKPSLYHQWKGSIHVELAKGMNPFENNTEKLNPTYFNWVYEQALSLFDDVFSAEDQMMLVTNVHQSFPSIRRKKKIKVYQHYLKNKNDRYRLRQETFPYMFEEEEKAEESCTLQFSLKCRKKDIRYQALVKAICNQDFPSLTPRFGQIYGPYAPDIFFINMSKNMIFYIYDDRGCELIASNLEVILPIYKRYADLGMKISCKLDKNSTNL